MAGLVVEGGLEGFELGTAFYRAYRAEKIVQSTSKATYLNPQLLIKFLAENREAQACLEKLQEVLVTRYSQPDKILNDILIVSSAFSIFRNLGAEDQKKNDSFQKGTEFRSEDVLVTNRTSYPRNSGSSRHR